jgi:cytidylate kinase
MLNVNQIPVIAIDGPSASGKGTIAQRVARRLGFHYLDSGALYRLIALAALESSTDPENESALARVAETVDFRFEGDDLYLNQRIVTNAIRAEAVSARASRVAALPGVRRALLERQRAFRRPPGLVADGRDMGSVVFPDAVLKIYLTADAQQRANRRYKQLIEQGMGANITTLLQDIRERDERDSVRAAAPLHQSNDATVLDTTGLTIDAAVEQVLARYAAATQVP